jgi:hypothetical protein
MQICGRECKEFVKKLQSNRQRGRSVARPDAKGICADFDKRGPRGKDSPVLTWVMRIPSYASNSVRDITFLIWHLRPTALPGLHKK